jgi:hypothetical protein
MHINCSKGHYAGIPNRNFMQIYWYDSRSRWPRGLRHRYVAARMLGLRVRTLRGHECLSLVDIVCCQTEVYTTGLFLIYRCPTEWDVFVCDLDTSTMRRPWPKSAVAPRGKNNTGRTGSLYIGNIRLRR